MPDFYRVKETFAVGEAWRVADCYCHDIYLEFPDGEIDLYEWYELERVEN